MENNANTTPSELYQVVFYGILSSSDQQTIKNKLSQDYQKSTTFFDSWFSGEAIILKKEISYQEAIATASYFENLGMEINVELVNGEYPQLDINTDDSSATIESYAYANFLSRFCAYLIDVAIFFILMVIIDFVSRLLGIDLFGKAIPENQIILTKIQEILNMDSRSWVEIMNIAQEYKQPKTGLATIATTAIFYPALMNISRYQGTIGKILLGLKVIDYKGNKISFIQSLIRSLLLYCPQVFVSNVIKLSCIMIFFTPQKQGLHDRLASSLVIFKKKSR